MIESLASAAILGVGVISLANMAFFSQDGLATSRHRASALELARQRVEWLATTPPEDAPNCVVVQGCRVDSMTYSAVKPPAGGYACSELLEGMTSDAPGSSAATTGSFRVDTVLEPHPDPAQQQGAQVLSVFVCWTDLNGQVHEVQAQRLLVPEV